MITCSTAVGIQTIACISQQTSYALGYGLLVLVILIVFFKLAFEPIKRRVGATLLVLTLMIALGSIQGMLFPPQYIIGALVLFIGSVFLLLQDG